MKKSTKYNCQICGQYMDFIVITYRNKPFVDGKNYSKICFGCAAMPKDEVQHYDKDGSITEVEGPFFDHKHLHTAVELLNNGSVESMAEAKKCVAGVRRAIREADKKELGKLKLKRPSPEYERNPEHDEAERAKWKAQNAKRKKK